MTPTPGNNPGTCPKCSSPLTPGMKFCESCGAKIEHPPVCGQCGAPLLVNAKFCDSCGKPVAEESGPPVSAAPPTSAPAADLVSLASEHTAAVPAPAEVNKPEPQPEPAATVTEKDPDKKTPEKPRETLPKTPGKSPASRTQTLVIGGVVGLMVVAALAYFVLLPMLSGTGTASGGNKDLFGAPPAPTASVSGTPVQNAGTISFVLEPTQVPPANLLVAFQADRDPISGIVTVTLTGGMGQQGVSDVSIRLSRSDGQVLTQTFRPRQIGDSTTLQGTKMTDRIEVIASYFNGEKYRIIDKIFEYKKRI